jgi:hypothetical protein
LVSLDSSVRAARTPIGLTPGPGLASPGHHRIQEVEVVALRPPTNPFRGIDRHQISSSVRTIGTVVAQMCDNPGYRLIITGIAGLIATAITWRDRRSMK